MAAESNQTVVTDENHGAILAIVTWCLGCILVGTITRSRKGANENLREQIFATALRIGTRFLAKNGPYVDDLCVIIAVVGGSAVCLALQVQNIDS